MFDKTKEDLREMFTGSNAENDLRARLHADHNEIARLLREAKNTEIYEVDVRIELCNQLWIGLRSHAKAEEEVVYSHLRTSPKLGSMVQHSLSEHDEIDRALGELRSLDPTDPGFLAAVTELERCVTGHVREEENDVLPKAEEVFGKVALSNLIGPLNERQQELIRQLRAEADWMASDVSGEEVRRQPGGMLDEASTGAG
jgi:hypothetical protein